MDSVSVKPEPRDTTEKAHIPARGQATVNGSESFLEFFIQPSIVGFQNHTGPREP